VLAGGDDALIRGGTDLIDSNDANFVDKQIVSCFFQGVFPPVFHKFRTKGMFCLRFFKDTQWRYVVIDDRLPIQNGYELIFAKCTNSQELWVPLIEKAYAKLFGCYEVLRGGNVDDGLVDMTGFACEKLTIHDSKGSFNVDKDWLWSVLMES
jgi:hypothetical protein